MDSLEHFLAAGTGDVRTLCTLLDEGADPNSLHPMTGHSLLYNACSGNQLDCIRTLLERGADPNLRMNYLSPVDARREKGIVALMFVQSVEAANLLLQSGADVNATDDNGSTPLIRAAHWGQLEVVQALLDAGADISIKTKKGISAQDAATVRMEMFQSFAKRSSNEAAESRIKKYQELIELLKTHKSF